MAGIEAVEEDRDKSLTLKLDPKLTFFFFFFC